MTSIWIFSALPLLFVCVLLYVQPALSRRTQFFAVTVARDFRGTAEARRIMRAYRNQVLAHSTIGVCAYAFAAARNAIAALELAVLWPVAGSLFAIALAHRAALRYAAPASGIRAASLGPRARTLPGGPLVWAGPFAILAAAAIYVGLHWSEIPQRFPIHWGVDGQPNGWAVRTVRGVFQFPALGFLVCLPMLFLAWQLGRNSRGTTAMRHLTARVLAAVAYFLAVLFGWLTAALPLGHGAPNPVNLGIVMGGTVLLIAAIVVFGMRAKAEPEPDAGPPSPAESAPPGDNTEDRYWRAGLFYFNPDDPVLFIEKRIGIGYDLNFGNPWAWVFIGAVLLIPLGVAILQKV
jgi:uncharacterized membrane protein